MLHACPWLYADSDGAEVTGSTGSEVDVRRATEATLLFAASLDLHAWGGDTEA